MKEKAQYPEKPRPKTETSPLLPKVESFPQYIPKTFEERLVLRRALFIITFFLLGFALVEFTMFSFTLDENKSNISLQPAAQKIVSMQNRSSDAFLCKKSPFTNLN